jgi:hypothetical protein
MIRELFRLILGVLLAPFSLFMRGTRRVFAFVWPFGPKEIV